MTEYTGLGTLGCGCLGVEHPECPVHGTVAKMHKELQEQNFAFAAAIASLPNPYKSMGERERKAHEAFQAGNDAEVVRIMAQPEPARKPLSPEDRAFLVVRRWFADSQADDKWWKRIGLWDRRDELTKAIAEEIRKASADE